MYSTEGELIAAFDTFENGCLSVCEFYDMFCDLTGICPDFEGECDHDGDQCPAEATVIFAEFDADDNDLLDEHEIFLVYVAHCPTCTKSINDLMIQYDLNQDWNLTLEEFKRMYCNECYLVEEVDCAVLATPRFE
jgi:hypothetical protein